MIPALTPRTVSRLPTAMFAGIAFIAAYGGAALANEPEVYAAGKMKVCMSKQATPNYSFVFATGVQFAGDDGVWIAPRADVTLGPGECKIVEGQVAPDFSRPSARPSMGVTYLRTGTRQNDVATATILAPFR